MSEDDVRPAAVALIAKLRAIESSASYRAVFVVASIHGSEYTGPKYADELAALEEALAAITVPA